MPDVDRFRALLLAVRGETLALIAGQRGAIASVSEARRDSNVDDEHDPEGSTIAFELSQATTLAKGSASRLEEIDAALARIEDGSYGVCAVCGGPIAEGRLEARPWTPYCIEHARGRA
ncbi:TraR/DksA C4-type zinc finger protein [Paenarthrobacter sp. DKR-5]|uniref:TraR/DksA family transcriptional regulator n=1 Tax=Paenarthrobacter sp. DKR-5 TaxID=2835535 RepID=UPI001BDBC49B|nr:TraR/DksA C4-type zinc finger protein [Paenarthrobacter sp. DKR-5]MBT1001544.1 TraR/DksA C4-type zinc finger protein [Paenarthrobacter sp. DKR-5]